MNAADFYRLMFDFESDGLYLPGDVFNERNKYLLPYRFTKAMVFDPAPHGQIRVEIAQEGRLVDFTMTYSAIPIASARLAAAVEAVEPGAIQRIALQVVSRDSQKIVVESGYEILNILAALPAVDLEKTGFERYPDDHYDAKSAGRIKTLFNIHLLPEVVHSRHLFRLAELSSIIVISRELKEFLQSAGFSGLSFLPLRE